MGTARSGKPCTGDFQVPLWVTDPNVFAHGPLHFSGTCVECTLGGIETCYMTSFDILIGLMIESEFSTEKQF